MKSYTLKIRGGVEVDSAGKKAGKGPLIAEEISNTLGTSQDQYLFQAVEDVTTNLILDDQGGQQISVRTDGKSPTLRAEMHGNQPCVLTFEPGIASRVGGHVYENISGTLRATPGDNQMAIVLENHPNDSRVRIDDSGTIQTLTSRCGTGGGNVPMVMQKVICLQGNGIDRADTAGCNGKGWTEDVSYTLNTIDRPAVVYSFDSLSSNSMKSSNPNSGCREVEVAKCLDTTIPDPSKNQGGIAIVYPKKTGTLMANSHPGSYCGQDAYNDMFVVENRGGYEVISLETFHCTTDDKAQPIKARDYKDPLVICYEKTKK